MNFFLFVSSLILSSIIFQSEGHPFDFLRSRTRRVVNGEVTFGKNFPWQIQLFKDGVFQCGGSIISNKWVLTAAHCVDQGSPKQYIIYSGSTFILKDNQHKVNQIIVHEGWNEKYHIYDVAVVKIEKEFTFDTFTQPVKLADSGSKLEGGTLLTVTGFGQTENGGVSKHVREGLLVTLTNKDCQDFLPSFRVLDQHTCVHYPARGDKGFCFGDSGGPLVDIKNVQQAIVSATFKPCGMKNAPSICANVPFFRNWVESKTGV